MEIEVSGVAEALQKIAKFADADKKLSEVARRLCQIGEPIINQIHGNHSSVWTEPYSGGYKIIAEGEDVLFIEFGAGDAAGSENGKYDAVPVVAYPGTWSEAHQGEYWKTGGPGQGHWHFGGVEYTELPPSPAFYYAYEYMCQNLPRIVKEVFDL